MIVFRRRGRRRPVLPDTTVRALVCAQLLGVTAALAAGAAGLCWWQSLLLGTAVAAAAMAPVRGRNLLSWCAAACAYPMRRDRTAVSATNFRSPGGPVVGLGWDLDPSGRGAAVAAVVEMLPPPGSHTELSRKGCEPSHRLPVAAIAESLNHHDLCLSGIDIVSHGARVCEGTTAADVYDQLIGPLPATARRTVWLVLRFDAAAESEAVARRGGGATGAARAASVAARRMVRTLEAAGCPARVLDAAEIDAAAMQVTRGVRPWSFARAWSQVPLPGACNTGYGITPRALSEDLLTELWAQPGLGTTVALRLRPGHRPGAVRIGASCRLTTRTRPDRLETPGLATMSGRHADALASVLPAAPDHLDSLTGFAEIDANRLDALVLPTAGCGQLIGSADDGRAVATRIVGPEIGAVEVIGELYLARQLVLRAIATGARVLVCSARPQDWAQLVDAIAGPDRVRLTNETRIDPRFTAVLFDGIEPVELGPGVTAIRLLERPGPPTLAPPDVTVVQPGSRGDRIVLRTKETRRELTLVTIAEETAFLGSPQPAAAVPGALVPSS
ncbi:type VII secretion protein EccE [Rhodococcus tukisamuensis]|uniref:Type VII secretion protein EccE n=1 Tax=Rhodococcus tukisamuensis TaxID=168276 RepID=A0A1G7BTM6_9NOCA|nr:type VII secretion protein EccE [Rhodococcus tukisamuensis]SDE30458.1 type VII secretion protein EccE [Rhodococcus tukisamuensis]